ncbi:MAG: ribonuclease E/G [Eubacteriales bacterium]|nr:ribonuclease E/G [Eubacteriales bacterium]
MNTVLLDTKENASSYAFLRDGVLHEFETWTKSESAQPGDIYLAKITRNIPSINACFADLGGQEGFLPHTEMLENTKCGDSVLVQIKRPAVGKKAPYLTQDISFAGEYIMYLPYSLKHGVSRRVEDKKQRQDMLKTLKALPKKSGSFVMRSKAISKSAEIIEQEAIKLTQQFEELKSKAHELSSLGLIAESQNPLEIFLKDNTLPVDEFYCNDLSSAQKYAKPFKHMQNPMQYKNALEQYKKALRRKIPLKSGASIVIDPCEAMTVIDVNSHLSTKGHYLSVNIEAAKEIARILRIRKTGGIILIDFIDMQEPKQYDKLLDFFLEALKEDRIKTDVLGFTKLGILEMTRKRAQTAAPQLERCPMCGRTEEENE